MIVSYFLEKNRTKRRIEDHSTEYCLANRILEEMWLFLDDAEFMKKYFSKHPFVFHTKKNKSGIHFEGIFTYFFCQFSKGQNQKPVSIPLRYYICKTLKSCFTAPSRPKFHAISRSRSIDLDITRNFGPDQAHIKINKTMHVRIVYQRL